MTFFFIILFGTLAALLHIGDVVVIYSGKAKIKKVFALVNGAVTALGLFGGVALYIVFRVSLSSSHLMDYAVDKVLQDADFFCLVCGIIAAVTVVITTVSVFVSAKFRPVRAAFLVAATVLETIATRMFSLLMDSKIFNLTPYIVLGGAALCAVMFASQFIDLLRPDSSSETGTDRKNERKSKKIASEKRRKIKSSGSGK